MRVEYSTFHLFNSFILFHIYGLLQSNVWFICFINASIHVFYGQCIMLLWYQCLHLFSVLSMLLWFLSMCLSSVCTSRISLISVCSIYGLLHASNLVCFMYLYQWSMLLYLSMVSSVSFYLTYGLSMSVHINGLLGVEFIYICFMLWSSMCRIYQCHLFYLWSMRCVSMLTSMCESNICFCASIYLCSLLQFYSMVL